MEDHRKWTANDEKVARIVRLKANRLVKSAEFAATERQDVEQELILRWLTRRGRFDAARGRLETFADVILNNAIRTMLEARRAGKRDERLCIYTLDDSIDKQAERGMTRHETYNQDDYFQAMGVRKCPPEELYDLRLDVGQALRRLSPRQRELAQRLMNQTVSEAARSMKISRTTLYAWLKPIREVFTELELDGYL